MVIQDVSFTRTTSARVNVSRYSQAVLDARAESYHANTVAVPVDTAKVIAATGTMAPYLANMMPSPDGVYSIGQVSIKQSFASAGASSINTSGSGCYSSWGF